VTLQSAAHLFFWSFFLFPLLDVRHRVFEEARAELSSMCHSPALPDAYFSFFAGWRRVDFFFFHVRRAFLRGCVFLEGGLSSLHIASFSPFVGRWLADGRPLFAPRRSSCPHCCLALSLTRRKPSPVPAYGSFLSFLE